VKTRALLALVLVVLAAVPAASGATRTVKLQSTSFGPRTVTIHAGDRIRFRWASGFHNVRRVSGPSFRRIASRDHGSVTRTFAKAGRYRLVCSLHRSLGMYLTVRVRA
jgi:plastocyanin